MGPRADRGRAVNNCLLYALGRWWRDRSASIVIRKSHWGNFPHFAVEWEMPDGSLIRREFVPIAPRKHWIPPLVFRGFEKTTVYARVVLAP